MPKPRRILSLWFPRLSVERVLRREGLSAEPPMAILRDSANMQVLSSLTASAEALGLRQGQPFRDATAACPELATRVEQPRRDAAFLDGLRRWAGKFSPWVAEAAPNGLLLDITGCAHLFDGEAALVAQIEADCAGFGLSLRAGVADTVGGAWALARFAGADIASLRNGDAIDQEARATRSRAAKRRHWERGGAAPRFDTVARPQAPIAPSGNLRQVLAPLPVAALRLPPETVAGLARVGLRRVGDLMGLPRAALSRRFGLDVVRRLDQALGVIPEPVNPGRAPENFSTRLTFPEPIGLDDDILAGIDRLLPPLCEKLAACGRGARQVRLQVFLCDETSQAVVATLARPSHNPDRIRPLLAMKLEELAPGFGIDIMRLEVIQSEPVKPVQSAYNGPSRPGQGLDDLIGKLGARIGMEAITRWHPAESNLPEKTSKLVAAAWSEPAEGWVAPATPRPMILFDPEPVHAAEDPFPPERFRWRGRNWVRNLATGPERIAPEWWLDDPAWRSGTRDYWRVETGCGTRLWLYFAHGGVKSRGWFCHGIFA